MKKAWFRIRNYCASKEKKEQNTARCHAVILTTRKMFVVDLQKNKRTRKINKLQMKTDLRDHKNVSYK